MSLPAPHLDDRRFQDLVDDAKRLVQQRCKDWTDHNVSDPGVTLIETFAFMVDQLIYRLNRVPERNYVKFLELIGVRLFPPTAASADVTFWLSAPQAGTILIPVGTQVATPRTGAEDAVVFTVCEERAILPCHLERCASSIDADHVRDHTESLAAVEPFYCFDTEPKPGDSLLIGLSNAVPGCAVLLQFACEIEGVGVDPRRPPLVWEAWNGEGWVRCTVDHDGTGGLNTAGDVIVHLPRDHAVSVISRERAGWLRCRVVEPFEDQPFYRQSPRISSLTAATIGGTTGAVHAELVGEEILGLSEGVAGQRFPVEQRPVVPGDEPLLLEVAGGDGWDEWTPVDDFSQSGSTDRHFMLDAVAGEVIFGPAVRQPDGTLTQYGAVPPKGAPLRLRGYWTGGGRRGNVAAKKITLLRETIPYVDRVVNRASATGGVDGETLENAKLRGPIFMRTRSRAVTVEDYEQLAREAAPEVARVKCVPAGVDGTESGLVRILVVPSADDEAGRLRFEQLLPNDETLERIATFLDDRRMIGARILVEPPVYQGITVVARLRAKPRVSPTRLQTAALEALYRHFNALTGGPDGNGWPFGRPIHVGEVYSVLQRLPGIDFVEDASLFAADAVTGERGRSTQRLEVSGSTLVFSFEHSVLVEES
ncbi:MAG TPA: putative baseplate assembly protein [Egibacteraceae bacterium]|nr:putative baseplate assembly protein [Egibacteraceae bacterium]